VGGTLRVTQAYGTSDHLKVVLQIHEASQRPIDVPGSAPFQKMDNLFGKVVTVSKEEIDRREQEWQNSTGRKKLRRKPDPIDSWRATVFLLVCSQK
jgi:hypothetical protein